LSILLEYDADGSECYSHPYAFEIDNFKIPGHQFLKRGSPCTVLATADTPLVMVDTLQKLKTMIEEIREFSEIGVDLEAHSYRTYLGLTCLIQVIYFVVLLLCLWLHTLHAQMVKTSYTTKLSQAI